MKKLLFILIFVSIVCAQNMSDTQVVTATGFGAILSGDMVKAREDAVNDALRKAVEQVVGMMIDAQTITENFMTIEDKIYTKTAGYVQNYEVISSQTRVDNSLEVTVRAVVKQTDLQNDLQGILTILKREGMPRLMVIVSEHNIGQYNNLVISDLNTTETNLMNEMMAYGFPFVDAVTAKANIQAAAAIAKQSGAEVLILGSAKTTVTQLPLMKSSGMKTCNANLNLRAVRADDAVIIATTSARGVAAHIDDLTGSTMALEKASKEAAESLKASIIEKYRQNQFESRQIQFEVSGITSFQQLNTLKNSLPYYIRGIKNVYQRNFEAGRALFDIEITQKAESVASEMANKTIENISLEITAVTQNKVSARIKEQTTNEGM